MIWQTDRKSCVTTSTRVTWSTDGFGTFMTTAEISDKLVIKGSIKKPMPLNRLGMVLKKAGYMQKCLGGKVRGWLVRERETAEINANRNINAKL